MTAQLQMSWRTRVLAVVLPLTALSCAAILAVAQADVEVTLPRVEGASETQCLPIEELETVRQLNEFAGTVRAGPEFAGADVGADVRLQDGRRVWVFGDTLRSPDFEGQQFVRNSMLLFSGGCAQVVLPAGRGAVLPDRADGVGYWPMSITRVERQGYDLLSVLAQRVRTTDASDGIFAFETLGTSVAVFIVPVGETPQLMSQRDIGPDDPSTTKTTWGAASAVHQGWIYLYGTSRSASVGVFGHSLQVARVRPEEILDEDRWRYWDGERWQQRADLAEVLIPAEGGVSQTLSVFPKNGRWYALSKRDEFLGTDLAVWMAPSPTGPFSYPVKLADIPSIGETGELRYMPLAHPHLLPGKNSVVVSYSRNNTDFDKVRDNPFLYRPRFLRVTLPE